MQEVKFTCTSLAGTKLSGRLPVDADGYYSQPIGGLNCFNSAGQYYPYETAKSLFEQSSSFMRRVKTGCLRGELGHPKRAPGQDDDSFAHRVMTIDEKSTCVHFAEIWLDFNSIKDEKTGKPIVAVMAKLKPSGPYSGTLEGILNNPKEDGCFSVRAFTDDVRRIGIVNRNLVEIVTYDYVTEPGINQARKYRSPTLEGHGETTFTKSNLEKAAAMNGAFALESQSIMAESLFRTLGWDLSHLSTPKFLDWK